MIQSFSKIKKIDGEFSFFGDKSISHRAVIFSSLAEGTSNIYNCSMGEDVKSTMDCFKELGVNFNELSDKLEIVSPGFEHFRSPHTALNANNSGTTARLISGILSNLKFPTKLVGDDSLSKRPMERIIAPLEKMGASIKSKNGFLPLEFNPSELKNISFVLPVASAQVKSCILLSGLFQKGITEVVDPFSTRDHTERMLNLEVISTNNYKTINVSSENFPQAQEYKIPGDISSASFFIVLTLLSNNSTLIIKNISLNPTRTGYLEVLKKMGANIEIIKSEKNNNELSGDLLIKSSSLKNISFEEYFSIIPNIIDEIPVLSIAGLFAEGHFEIRGAKELRIKESDRISALCNNFRKLGLEVEEYEDGFYVDGMVKNTNTLFESYNDHRIAMSFAILSSFLGKGGSVNGFECVNISNPSFLNQLNSL